MSEVVDRQYKAMTKALYTDGVCVVPLLEPTGGRKTLLEEAGFWKNRILDMIYAFPEYNEGVLKGGGLSQLGGFGAAGNPSSFHAPEAVGLRRLIAYMGREKLLKAFVKHAHKKIRKDPTNVYHNALQGHSYCDWYFLTQFDRILCRREGMAPTAESFHRDVGPGLSPEMIQFGGFTNLTLNDMFFSCVPGTHMWDKHGIPASTMANLRSGFAALKGADKAAAKANTVLVRVPPGHTVVFFSHLVHEVVATKSKHDQIRQFHGWQLSFNKDLPSKKRDELREIMRTQGVPWLPSGQWPRVYGANHGTVFNGPWPVASWAIKELLAAERDPTTAVQAAIAAGHLKLRKNQPLDVAKAYATLQSRVPPYDLHDPHTEDAAYNSNPENEQLRLLFKANPSDNDKTNVVYWANKTFRPEFLTMRTHPSGLKYNTVPGGNSKEAFPSLQQALPAQMYPPYDLETAQELHPQRMRPAKKKRTKREASGDDDDDSRAPETKKMKSSWS